MLTWMAEAVLGHAEVSVQCAGERPVAWPSADLEGRGDPGPRRGPSHGLHLKSAWSVMRLSGITAKGRPSAEVDGRGDPGRVLERSDWAKCMQRTWEASCWRGPPVTSWVAPARVRAGKRTAKDALASACPLHALACHAQLTCAARRSRPLTHPIPRRLVRLRPCSRCQERACMPCIVLSCCCPSCASGSTRALTAQALLKLPGARLVFGGKPLDGHTIPPVYGAVEVRSGASCCRRWCRWL